MKKITCSKCGHEQDFNPHITKMIEGVERVYLVCEKCRAQYTAYYTDKPIRALQARQRKIAKKISKERGAEFKKLYEEYEDNKQKITILLFELRRKMELEHPPG